MTRRFEMTPETLAKIRGAKNAVQSTPAKIIRCPYCGHRMSEAYAGASGYIREKCSACKRECVIDLVSWRRRRSFR